MKRVHLIKLWLTVTVLCAGLAACAVETSAGPSPGMTSLPSWDHVLFVWNQDGLAELWTLDPVSCAVKRRVRPKHTVKDPALSPSGKTIAYVRTTGDYGNVPSELWLMDRDGTSPRPLYVPVPGQGVFSRIAWQPDGQAIYFVQSGSGTGHQLQRIPIDGGEATTILTDCLDFALHPDGESLVAMSLDRRLGVFAPDGSRLRALVPDGTSFSDYHSFAASPDGHLLAFRGTESGGVDTWNLYVMDWSGRNVRRLTDLKGFQPATSGSGQVNGLAWAGWIGDKAQLVYSGDGHPQQAGIWLADLRGDASIKLFGPEGGWFAVRGPWFESSTR